MGKYTFIWEHAAHDVHVTGTFDDWRKTVKLEQEDGVFKKTVELPKEKTLYKFVVNGAWCISQSAAQEDDGHGSINNVLQPEDIADEPVDAFLSLAPQSTTAALAGAVPKESQKMENTENTENAAKSKVVEKTRSQDSIPGAFPMTPPVETPGSEPKTFNVSPLPATSGLGNPIKLAPGEPVPDVSTFTNNTVHSTVRHDEEPEVETVSVAPFPATAGLGNPIHLAPGQKVPDASTLSPHTVQSTVNTDIASYEKPDSLPPKLELGLTPTAEREASGGMFHLPPVLGNMIPESSLPMGADAKVENDTGITIQSAAPLSSTAVLAGQVPKETRVVPETVTESQKEAGFAPEAAANPEAVLEKKEVEQELLEKVPEAPVTADDTTATMNTITSSLGTAASTVAGAATAGVVAGADLFTSAIYSAKEQAAHAVGLDKSAPAGDVAYAVKDKAVDAVGLDSSATAAENANTVKDKAVETAVTVKDQTVAAADTVKNKTVETAVTVKDQTVAAADTVKNKTVETANIATENAYIAKDKAVEAVGLDKSATATDNAYLAKDKVAQSVGMNGSTTADNVPAIVSESQKEAHVSPEAATNAEAVTEKSQFEQELLSQVHKTTDQGESAPAVAVPEIVSESQRAAHVSPEAAANAEAVAEKKEFESELLNVIPKANETGEPAPVIAVPAIVSESQREAHASPEASGNAEAVYEKKALESQLLSSIPKANEAGEPAPVITAATIGVAPGAKSVEVANDVPDVVAESQKEAHVSPGAAANAEAVSEKKSVEAQLLNEIEKSTSSGEPAPVIGTTSTIAPIEFETLTNSNEPNEPNSLNAPASAPAQPATMERVEPTSVDINAHNPTTTEQTEPTVTTGVETTTIPQGPTTPPQDANASLDLSRKDSDVSPMGTPGSQSIASGADDKKKKRRSLFGKLKDKLSNKP